MLTYGVLFKSTAIRGVFEHRVYPFLFTNLYHAYVSEKKIKILTLWSRSSYTSQAVDPTCETLPY